MLSRRHRPSRSHSEVQPPRVSGDPDDMRAWFEQLREDNEPSPRQQSVLSFDHSRAKPTDMPSAVPLYDDATVILPVIDEIVAEALEAPAAMHRRFTEESAPDTMPVPLRVQTTPNENPTGQNFAIILLVDKHNFVLSIGTAEGQSFWLPMTHGADDALSQVGWNRTSPWEYTNNFLMCDIQRITG